VLENLVIIWLSFTAASLWIVMACAWIRIHKAVNGKTIEVPYVRVEIVVPVKGVFPGHEAALESLTTQDYPCHAVLFVLESDTDPANAVVDAICGRRANARKVLSGISSVCAQKIHNLIVAANHLRPDTEIVVFCDSTNSADTTWLERFTRPIRSGDAEVVTTFRVFQPDPETLGGTCQAIYAAFVRLLATNKPKPWGGATGIKRDTIQRLDVLDAWSNTVVDDLVLGNVLERAGVSVYMNPVDLLESRLPNQTIGGFLGFLDRQIMFPKFTNPDLWILALCSHLNLTSAMLAAFVIGCLHVVVGVGNTSLVLCSYAFWAAVVIFALVLRSMNPSSVGAGAWLRSFVPCVLFAAFIFCRSLFRNYIDWHGRRYLTGKQGIVKAVRFIVSP